MITYTQEQFDIIYSDQEELYVLARAGTGKTTTLVEFAKVRPMESILYLAYNDSIRKEATRKFFGNTDVHTIHSLAWREIGHFYKEKFSPNLRMYDIIQQNSILSSLYKSHKEEAFSIAGRAVDLLGSFFNSSYDSIEEMYPPEDLLDIAKEYWDCMQRFDSDIKMTHDGYVKIFQLSKPVLNYDYILVDEAQDSNKVMLDVVESQAARKVFVGDDLQSIYGYRNTVSVFENVPDHNKKYLTKSFRFGPNIANHVNKFITAYGVEEGLLEGLGDTDDFIGKVDTSMPYTQICRTNAYLFDQAFRAATQGKKIYIIGGSEEIFNRLLDTYNLMRGQLSKVRSIYIKEFKTFRRLEAVAKKTQDQELKYLAKVTSTYQEGLLDAIEVVKNALTKEKFANIVFTTAHKAKGLEFYNVKISEDFANLYTRDGFFRRDLEREEVNIIYVALTRAIDTLELNSSLRRFFTED